MEMIYGVSLVVSLMMIGSVYVFNLKNQIKFLGHTIELALAFLVNITLSFIIVRFLPDLAVLAMFTWVLLIRAYRHFLEDLTSSNLFERWRLLTIGGGIFLSLLVGASGQSFLFYSFPFAMSVTVVGLSLVRDSGMKIIKEGGGFKLVALLASGTFFLFRLLFPLWGKDPVFGAIFFMGEFVLLAVNLIVSLLVTMDFMNVKHEDQLNSMLKERTEKLFGQSKYAELGMMSAGIAHEINNPLAVIQARTTQLLRICNKEVKNQELTQGLNQILYTSERIGHTIQGIREFVYHDEKSPPKELSVKELMDDVLTFTGQRFKNHGISLRFYDLEKYHVLGNKIQIEQIILNLLNNSFDAIEFLPDKWIEVSAHKNGDKIELYFKDSGKGIPKDIADKMMEPFFSTKAVGKGTGLGLALARGIAEKHGGKLSYRADMPHTTFLLELPESFPKEEWESPMFH